jgi:hypothetical protein
MSYNLMIGYDIYDHCTMEHFPLRQSMILTTSFFGSRQYIMVKIAKIVLFPLIYRHTKIYLLKYIISYVK